mgnify:FL=1
MGENFFEVKGRETSPGINEKDTKREDIVQKIRTSFAERLALHEKDIMETMQDSSKSRVDRAKMLILQDATGDELLLAKHSGNRYQSLKVQLESILRDFESNNYSSAYLFLENEIAEFQRKMADTQQNIEFLEKRASVSVENSTEEDPALEEERTRVAALEELIAEAEELKDSLIIEE